jgi:hypothetical protein
MFFDVGFEWDKTLTNEIGDFPIGVRLSFQLSACASSGRRREVNQHRLVLSFSFGERGIDIFDPIDEHVQPSFRICLVHLNEQAKYLKGAFQYYRARQGKINQHAWFGSVG